MNRSRQSKAVSLAVAMSVALIQGCNRDVTARTPEAANASITVQAWYRERMLLPPGSNLRVVMEDSALMDVAATLIAEQTLAEPGAPPYRLNLEYDPAKLNDRGRYTVRAQIRNDGKLLFTSTSSILAFAPNDQGVVEVLMERAVSHESAPEGPNTVKP